MKNAHINNEETRNRKAAAWMMVSVISVSFLGLVIDWAKPDTSPLFFASLDNMFAGLCVFAVMAFLSPHLFSRRVIKSVLCPPQGGIRMNLLILPCIISGFMTLPLLALSAKYIGIMSTIIIFETRLIFLILLNTMLFRKDGKFQPLTLWVWFLLILGLIGFGFVIVGQSGGKLPEIDASTDVEVLWGGFFALAAAFTSASLISFSIKHAEMSKQKIKEAVGINIDAIFCVAISLCTARIVAGSVLLLASVYLEEEWTDRVLYAGIIIGVFITAVSNIAVRQSNLIMKNLGVNALRYTAPLFAALWLLLFSDSVFANLDYLIIGAAAIITANLLINCEAEIRHGYKSLVVALWVCGTIVYLREGASFINYYEFAGIVLTIFILILSFRTDRLVRRTASEEENMLTLWHQMPVLKNDAEIKNARMALLKIDAPKEPEELRNSYKELISYFSPYKNEITHSEILTKIDFLAHSKQQGGNFGELISLFIIALITVFGMLFFMPSNASGWNGFFAEMSAFLLSSMVLFLYFNILDLQRDRARPILEESDGKFSIAFRDPQNRNLGRWISIIICTGIILAFGWLLWGKWLG